jgi:enoyl-CoA hydratase/3-hydroxyacyl-CoA dehydrogenase
MFMLTQLPHVNVEAADGIATITINRPDALNLINPALVHQLRQAFEQAIAAPEVSAIVLGAEGKAFVAGADIDFLISNIESGDIPRIAMYSQAGHELMNLIDHAPKIVVARVNGTALGGGLELALACDTIVAAEGASLGFPETSLGIYPGFGGTQRTPRRVGIGLAKWLLFTAKTISAAEARGIGLVDQVVPLAELDNAALRIARGERASARPPLSPERAAIEHFFAANRVEDIRTGAVNTGGDMALGRAVKQVAGRAPVALRLAELLIDEGSAHPLEEALRLEIDHVFEIFATTDAHLGLSFRAKKQLGQPAFSGR